jgi:hypothetical protein
MQLCCQAFLVMIGREERNNMKESLAVSFQYVITISHMIGICKIPKNHGIITVGSALTPSSMPCMQFCPMRQFIRSIRLHTHTAE